MSNQQSDTTSMDQVRDLLMGTQLKDMESRIQRQEERLLREIATFRDSLKARADSLENFMKSETSTIMHRLQEERAERSAALKDEQRERIEAMRKDKKEAEEALEKLAKDLAAMEDAMERRLAALSGTLDRAEQELRQLMLAENARLSEKAEEKYREALSALSNTAEQIRSDVVSRSSLSSLLGEVAMKISGPWPAQEAPGEDEPGPGEADS